MALVKNVVTSTQATTSAGVSQNSNSFSPSAGALVKVLFTYMFFTNTTGVTFTVTDSHSNTYTLDFTPLNNGGVGATYVGMASFVYNSAPGTTTVKVTASSTGSADCLITPIWFTGQAASQAGAAFASNTNGSSGTTCEQTITPTTFGSYVVIAGAVAAVTVTSTAISGTTLANSWSDANSGSSANAGTTTGISMGGQINTGFTLSGTSTFGYSIAALEILPAVTQPWPIQAVQVTNTATPVNLTLPLQTTAGNTLVALVGTSASPTNPTVSSITLGGAADHWAQAISPVGNPSSADETAFAWIDPGCAGGQTAVAVTLSASAGSNEVTVLEFPGIVTASPVDQTSGNNNDSTGLNSWTTNATGNTSQNSEVAVAHVTSFKSTGVGTLVGPAAPWIVLPQLTSASTHVGQLVAVQPLTATQAVTYNGTSSAVDGYAALVITLKTASAVGDMPQFSPGPTWLRRFKPGYREATQLVPWSNQKVLQTTQVLAVTLPTLVTNISAALVHDGPMALVVPPPVTSLNTFYENNQSVPAINPGPAWLERFKPGLLKVRPATPWSPTVVEFGPLNIPLPTLTTNITAVQTNPADIPVINPGPTWLALFKRALPKTQPYTTFDLKGESGTLPIVLPTLITNINAVQTNPSDLTVINPGPTWLALFKPGMRKRPVEQDDRIASTITGSLVIILSPGCRVQLEAGPMSIVMPTLNLGVSALEQYGNIHPVLPTLVTGLTGTAQQTIQGAFNIKLPPPIASVNIDNGRETCVVQLVLPTLVMSVSSVVVHYGTFNILFLPCGSHMVYQTRHEMFGSESRGDFVLGLPGPVMELEGQVARERQPAMTSWVRARQGRIARRDQIQSARAEALERLQLGEDSDDG